MSESKKKQAKSEVGKKQPSTDISERSLTSNTVTRRDYRVISGADVDMPQTASSKVAKQPSKAVQTSKKATANGRPKRERKARIGGKGEGETLAQRAKLQKTVMAVSAAKSIASTADDNADSERDAASLSTQEIWQRTENKLRARKGDGTPLGKKATKDMRVGQETAPEGADVQVQPRKLTIRNVTTKKHGTRNVGPRKIAGRVSVGTRSRLARADTRAGGAKAAQAQRNAAAVKAQQEAVKKTAGSGLKKLVGAIGAATGIPVGTVVLIVFGVILAIALAATLLAAFIGGADSERHFGQMNEVEAAVAQRLLEMGFDNVHAAAAMGNIYGESSFNLGSVEYGGGGGLGLMGWTTASSHTRLFAIAGDMGKPWTDLDVQLQMMEEWINKWNYANSYVIRNKLYGYDSTSWDPEPGTVVSASRARFDASNDLRECVDNFCYGCEAPGIPRIKVRFDKAEEYLDMLDHPSSGNIELVGGKLGDPLSGYPWVLSSPFGYRDFDHSVHKGMDMAAPEGTPYYAAESGRVLYATNDGGYNGGAGNWVVIDHGDGLVTKYMHSSAVFVRPGQQVNKGDHIGNVGNTGASFGAHLHFQVEVNGAAVDPAPYIGR